MKKYSIRHEKRSKNNHLLSDGKFALGLAIGAIGFILIGLILEISVGDFYPVNYYNISPLIISLIVGLTSTFLATSALLEQRKAREASTDPVLIAHLGQRADALELMTFNLSNIGAGAALNVVLDVKEPAGGIAGRTVITDIFRIHHPFTVIPQGKSIEFNFAISFNVLGEDTFPPFQAHLSYEDITGEKYESEFKIDVREMSGLGAHKTPQMRMVAALEKIAAK